jgi:hypothetical protein
VQFEEFWAEERLIRGAILSRSGDELDQLLAWLRTFDVASAS